MLQGDSLIYTSALPTELFGGPALYSMPSVAGRVPVVCYHCSLECDKSSINVSFVDTGTCIQNTYNVVEGGVSHHCKLPEKCVPGEHLIL